MAASGSSATVNDSQDSESLAHFLEESENLILEASEAHPHRFDTCTYDLGPIKQSVYWCKTCGHTAGICGACSISCHGDHEQIELFAKRAFQCDCSTAAFSHTRCALQSATRPSRPANNANVYGHNFRGEFCRCGKSYDAATETETMIQCHACEDWFHESCVNLKPHPSSSSFVNFAPTLPNSLPGINLPELALNGLDSVDPTEQDSVDVEDGSGDEDDLGLPAVIKASSYETFFCGTCVRNSPTLRRWAGTAPFQMIIWQGTISGQGQWVPFMQGIAGRDEDIDMSGSPSAILQANSNKRSASLGMSPPSKRIRINSPETTPTPPSLSCTAPSINKPTQHALLFSSDVPNPAGPPADGQSYGDVFAAEGWQECWCKCNNCLPLLEREPYLIDDEDIYEPPEDPDAATSFEELGLRALESLPREQTLDGIHAYNNLRDDLMAYLRPFAVEGKIVSKGDVQSFFAARKEALQAASK